jgi:hypothetical protein
VARFRPVAIDESPPSTVGSARKDRSKTADGAQRAGAWSSAAGILERCAWVAFPVAGMLWVGGRYSRNWYVADEWLTFSRMTGSRSWISGAFAGTFGHLMVPTHSVYWLQKTLWGVEGHQLVWFVFCLSLAALQLSIAAVLFRLGLPTFVALLAASVVTLFGPGPQDMLWQFQLGVNFAFALCFAAAFLALGDRVSQRMALAVAGLLLLAVGFDSSLALLGAFYVGVIIVLSWPRRLSAIALGPAAVAHLAWLAFGSSTPYVPQPVGRMTSFAWHLSTLAAGGLVGGGETKRAIEIAVSGSPRPPTVAVSGEAVGIIVLALATICVAFGFARNRLPRKVAANFAGGSIATVLTVATLAKTRAIGSPVLIAGTRFVQWVAIFLLLALLPAITATLRPSSQSWRRLGAISAGGALIGVFVLNLGQLRPVRQFQEAYGTNLKADVRQTITVLSESCGPGRRPNLGAGFKQDEFLGYLKVGVVQDFLDRGELTADFGTRATPEVREAICTPSARSVPALGVEDSRE